MSMTPKQKEALKLGQRIRQILCCESIALRHFALPMRESILQACDDQLHALGYESTLERHRRLMLIEEDEKRLPTREELKLRKRSQ